MMKKRKLIRRPNKDRVKRKKNPNAVEYVNNEFFYDEIKKYRKACSTAEKKKKPRPRMPETIGDCISKIAHNFARKYNFADIPFKNEMIGDAIVACVRAIENDNFDPEYGTNPFAFFSQITYYAFLRRINEEEKHQYIKYSSINQHFTEQGEEMALENISISNVLPEDVHEFMSNYERKRKEKSEKTKQAIRKKKKQNNIMSLFVWT